MAKSVQSSVYQAGAEALGQSGVAALNPLFIAPEPRKHMPQSRKYARNGAKQSMQVVSESRCISQGTYLSNNSQPSAIMNFD
jgi:hypothetical protein